MCRKCRFAIDAGRKHGILNLHTDTFDFIVKERWAHRHDYAMKYLSQFLIILGFTLTGEALQRVIPLPIPASVYGIALLFTALCLKIVKVEQVKEVGGFLSSILPLLFVSPTVGIVQNWNLIKPNLLPMALLLLGSTIAVFGISGRITQLLMKKGGGQHE